MKMKMKMKILVFLVTYVGGEIENDSREAFILFGCVLFIIHPPTHTVRQKKTKVEKLKK